MSEWDFMSYEGRANVLATVRSQADAMLTTASYPENWEAPTGAGHWEVRDVIGHLVETTEEYLNRFEIARSGQAAPAPIGLRDMAKHVDEGALSLRSVSQAELIERCRSGLAQMLEVFEGLSPEDWGGLMVPHKYMGPLPAFFYAAFQLVDYAVHLWDIREGQGRAHALDGDAADLLVPVCFVLWQATADCAAADAYTIGVRVSGRNGGDTRITVSADGLSAEPGPVDDLPAVLEFDPASFVLTAFGRINGGTARGDAATAAKFCNLFFRI